MSNKKTKIIIGIVLAFIAIAITMCNYISISNAGYLSTDVAVWVNIAKGISQGKIIYKDMFDHKGPMLYFFYYLGYIIGNQFGIYLLDFGFNAITVYMVYLISKLIVKEKWKIFAIILICATFLIKLAYENPCTESIAIAFTLIAYYQGIKLILENSIFETKNAILTAICFAIVLLLRPNLLLFWVLFYLFIFIKYILDRKIKDLFRIIISSIAGVAIILIPVFIYFIWHNAFSNLLDNYLWFNLEYSSFKETDIITVIEFLIFRPYFIIMGVTYTILFNTKKKIENNEFKLLVFNFIYFLFSLLLTIMPQRCYLHYLIAILPTLIIPLAIILKGMNWEKISISLLFLIIGFAFLNEFLYAQVYRKKSFTQFKSVQQYLQPAINCSQQEDNVLVLGNKTMIYLLIDRKYNGKYFYQTPIANQNERMSNEIVTDIKDNLPELIIYTVNFKKEEGQTSFKKHIEEILDGNYTTQNDWLYIKRKEEH